MAILTRLARSVYRVSSSRRNFRTTTGLFKGDDKNKNTTTPSSTTDLVKSEGPKRKVVFADKKDENVLIKPVR